MCEACHQESDDDYEGSSVEEFRTKATRSILTRHPELGVDPKAVTYRFAPRAERRCVRVNLNGDHPRYEIHVPSYMAQAMSGSPSLGGIAMVAWLAGDQSYEAVCDTLDVRSDTHLGAFFVADEPPINTSRSEQEGDVIEFERALDQSADNA